jgi:3-(methylthio)propanoyl-CoA dehydrogenase
MSTYRPPLRDMEFVIDELIALESMHDLHGFTDVNLDLAKSIFEEAGRFATSVLAPLNQSGDRQGCRLQGDTVITADGFKEAYRKFVDGGWNALTGKAEFGGQELPQVIAVAVQEMWNSANMSFCLCPMLSSGATEALLQHGSPELQQRFLPKLISGVWTGTMNLTEPQAGSDLSAVRCRAVPEEDHYRLYGVKIFITWGEHDMAENIVHLVLARTPNAPEGVKGISLFVVPKVLVNDDGSLGKRNDVHCVSIESKLGIHASPTAMMAFGDKDGAVAYLVGEENHGLAYMFTMMNLARLGVGVEGVGIAERAYQHALDYARSRVQGRELGVKGGDRVTIIHHPDVRRMLMLMKAQIEAMRALAYVTGAVLDKAQRHPDPAERARSLAMVELMIPVVKACNTETAIDIASLGIQIHGGVGYVEATGAAQYLRDARITTIYEGTTGIQANDLVGRKISRDSGATLRALIAEIEAFATKLGREQDQNLQAIAASLTLAVASLSAAARHLLSLYQINLEQVFAVAVPFVRLLGYVACGWQMARAAQAAHDKLLPGNNEADFYKTKLVTARFYADHILPQALALGHTVVNGAESVLTLGENRY